MRWNYKFKNLCKEITENSDNIDIVAKLLQTYVDDTKIVAKEVPAGARYNIEEKKNRN